MRLIDGKIRWVQRVEPSLIVRLYESDAKGFQDEDLVDEVGCAIFARAEDVITATLCVCYCKAKCPVCGEIISFDCSGGTFVVILECICGYTTTLTEYRKSFQGQKLTAYRALYAIEKFIQQYIKAKDYSSKMLAIDLLIHTFHNELQNKGCHIELQNRGYGRPIATNILYARTERQLINFLNKLAYSDNNTPGILSNREQFFSNIYKSCISSHMQEKNN